MISNASDSNVSHSPTLIVENETLMVSGTLTFDSVVKIWNQGLKIIQSHASAHLYINLANLLSSDSSSLALWASWMRAAYRQKKTLNFKNVPKFMQDLIRVHGLETLLPSST